MSPNSVSTPLPHLSALVTLLSFTSTEAAASAYQMLNDDLANCESITRPAQRALSLPADASITRIFETDRDSAWTLTASGFADIYARPLNGPEFRAANPHAIVLVWRGPFIEIVAATGDPDSMLSFTPASDHAIAEATAAALCSFDIDC